MLKKKYILNNKKVFAALKSKGIKAKIGSFLVSYFSNQSRAANNRFGVIISAKTVAKAHERNEIKRQIRAILFPFKDQNYNNQFLNMAIIILNAPKKDDYDKLANFLDKKFN